MSKMRWLVLLAILVLPLTPVQANSWPKLTSELGLTNLLIRGKVIDHTANHGTDRRIWSRSLGQRRDLYVYLPPEYASCHRYPIMIWMHGLGEDEQSFLRWIVPMIDQAICEGRLPPMIVAAPDGSLTGEPHPYKAGSFFINSAAGDFEDWVLMDTWDFVTSRYSVRSEREVHILAGWSMGGFAAFHLGIKHRNAFGVVAAINPFLNLRWTGKNGHYFQNFDPFEWGWRMEVTRRDIIGIVPHQGRVVCLHEWFEPLFPDTPSPIMELAGINPIELVDRLRLCEGDLKMFVGYGGHDEYNTDAQVESFLYLCKWRRLTVWVDYQRQGGHLPLHMKNHLPTLLCWLGEKLAPYCGGICPPPGSPSASVAAWQGAAPGQPLTAPPLPPRPSPLRYLLPCPGGNCPGNMCPAGTCSGGRTR